MNPIFPHALPFFPWESILKAPNTLDWLRLPIVNSVIIIGKHITIKNNKYKIINTAPPLFPTK